MFSGLFCHTLSNLFDRIHIVKASHVGFVSPVVWVAGVFCVFMCAPAAHAASSAVAPQQAVTAAETNAPAAQVSVSCEAPSNPNPLKHAVADYEGQNIINVRFRSKNVFNLQDPSENKAIYRFLNRIHRNTRVEVIESQLLFKAGQTLDPDVLDETERLLRGQPYLASATVSVDQVCDGGVVVLVETRDVWTTEPEITISREGDANKSGFGLTEKNVSGTGTAVSIGYLNTAERSEIRYGIFTPHLFNSRVAARFGYSDNSDGENTILDFRLPFYSLQTKWSAGVTSQDQSLVERIRYRDEDINRYKHEDNYAEAFVGVKLYSTHDTAHRALVGVTHDKHVFERTDETINTPSNYNLVYPWLEYQYLENRFAKYKNLRYMHRVEDVPTGKQLRIRLGYGRDGDFQSEEVWYTAYEYTDLLAVQSSSLLSATVTYEGLDYATPTTQDASIYGGYLEYFHLLDDNDRWYGRLQYYKGNELREHNELTLGGEVGLRGYPLDFQRGTEQTVFTLERRHVTQLHILNLLRVGVLAFYEIGRVTGGGYEHAPYLSNVGLGLRLASSKARIGNVIHIDLAYPLTKNDDIKSVQLVVKASSAF